MAQISIEIKGLKKLTSMAERFPAISEKYINTAIVKGLGEIYANMSGITPVDSSRLREDFHVPKISRFYGSIGTKLPYAERVHDMYSAGTPYKHPSKNKSAVAGFLTIASQQSKPQIDNFFSEALEDITNELAKAI